MGLNIEAARSYGVGVLKRTFGVDAYQRWQRYVESSDDIPGNYSFKENRRITGVILGAVQTTFPSLIDAVTRITTAEQNVNPFVVMGKNMPALITDFVSWSYLILPAAMQNPLEAVAIKLAVNLATPVVLDLANVAIERIQKFRPLAPATLAV